MMRSCLAAALLPLLCLGSACSQVRPDAAEPRSQPFTLRSLAKNDIDGVLEIHVREVRTLLRSLMEKLYMRNPRELEKSPYPDAAENIRRIFSRTSNWNFRELDGSAGIEAIQLTFADGYAGDRVFCFMAGLTSMVMASYKYKTEFYLYDNLHPQALYNSARNIEIAVWKLSNDHNTDGELFLYSNSLPGETSNLSYERLFGKLISLQDTMASILAGKTNRAITKVVQRMATAVFLPVP